MDVVRPHVDEEWLLVRCGAVDEIDRASHVPARLPAAVDPFDFPSVLDPECRTNQDYE